MGERREEMADEIWYYVTDGEKGGQGGRDVDQGRLARAWNSFCELRERRGPPLQRRKKREEKMRTD